MAPDVFASDLHVVDSVTFDSGTDPGDDVTMYLIESRSGPKGYLVLSDSFHADPRKAVYIDALTDMPPRNRQSIAGKEKLSE